MRVWIGHENVDLYHTLDWEAECDRFRTTPLAYPNYYASQAFHGIPQGYLTPVAPVTYDAVTAIAAPPNEAKIRARGIACISGQPSRILDLGCGTGSSTLLLAKAFPNAQIVGLDLSPYMLVYSERKAQCAPSPVRTISWQQGLAERTPFDDASFDLVTASFLLHELPPQISRRVLQECQRVLVPGGQFLLVDGHQRKLRSAGWAIALFREPYSASYAEGDLALWLDEAGMTNIHSKAAGWISQITTAYKP